VKLANPLGNYSLFHQLRFHGINYFINDFLAGIVATHDIVKFITIRSNVIHLAITIKMNGGGAIITGLPSIATNMGVTFH
jgi:hypothetical protein